MSKKVGQWEYEHDMSRLAELLGLEYEDGCFSADKEPYSWSLVAQLFKAREEAEYSRKVVQELMAYLGVERVTHPQKVVIQKVKRPTAGIKIIGSKFTGGKKNVTKQPKS